MFDCKTNYRNYDEKSVLEIAEKYSRMSTKNKEVLELAVIMIHHVFGKDPALYDFDFRFNKRQ